MNRCLYFGAALVAVLACGRAQDSPVVSGGAAKAKAPSTISAESAGDVVIRPLAAAYAISKTPAAASVAGSISLKAALQPLEPTPTGRDSAACGVSIPDESLQQLTGGLGGVVVWLEGIHSGKAPSAERRLELESLKCKLSPRVQAAMVGSAFNIIGHDELRQHLRFVAPGDSSPRATILLGGGEQVIPTELPFKAPGMVAVRDKDHPWTRAYIAVFDHPYFAVTAPNGAFTIAGVPAGTYTLHAWHERTGATTQQVVVGASGVVNVKLAM